MHELMLVTGSSRRKLQAKPKRKLSFVVAARLLGGILGERLYFGYHKKILSRQTLVGFLKKPVSSESFSVAYYEMLEVIDALPVPFHSKKEKLGAQQENGITVRTSNLRGLLAKMKFA